MSAKALLYVDGYPIIESTASLRSIMTEMFVESDRVEFERHSQDRNPLVFGECKVGDPDFGLTETAILYRAHVWECADRLDVRGITLERARERFEKGRADILDQFAQDEKDLEFLGYTWSTAPPDADLLTDLYVGDLRCYQSLTFDAWLDALRIVFERRLLQRLYGDYVEQFSRAVDYVLNPDEWLDFGFLGDDQVLLQRCFLAVAPQGGMVELDVTGIIESYHLSTDQPVCFKKPFFSVLTEGSSDVFILRGALKHLYPHLDTYYNFVDFESTKLPGGISNNIQVVKTFVALSIQDKLIVLFDNDTAAADGIRALEKAVTLTGNIRLVRLPATDLCSKYPTLGPSGPAVEDINGRAVSIELFAGPSVLRRADGDLPPVRWRSYIPAVRDYQGEVEDKKRIQEELSTILWDEHLCGEHDWSDMRTLWNTLFAAFS